LICAPTTAAGITTYTGTSESYGECASGSILLMSGFSTSTAATNCGSCPTGSSLVYVTVTTTSGSKTLNYCKCAAGTP